jgi:hypothetical protein
MSPLFDVLRRWPEGFSSALPEGPWVHDAIRHGVAPFVADSLALGGQRVPIELVNAARGQLTTGRRHRAFTLDVIDALASDGVTPTLLKGYGLATRLYATPLSRPSVDVDLAIAPRSMPVAEQAMARLGLSLQADSALDDELEEHHHRAWAGPRGLVELHHRLASGLGGEGLDDDDIERRLVDAELEGRRVRYLSPEDELLYLCVHAATHAFLRVSWLLDVKRFLTVMPSLDWVELVRRAQAVSQLRSLRAALALSERLVGARLPDAARAALSRFSVRATFDPLVFSEAHVASADWASARIPSVLLHLYLTDSARLVASELFAGAKRALRRARSAA